MKNLIQKSTVALLLAGALLCIPSVVSATNVQNDITNPASVVVKDDLIGGWEYSVEGAPEGYEKGLMMIVKQGDIYKVQVQLRNGAVNATDVVVTGNKATFNLVIDGETVAVALEANGSKLTGTSTSPTNGVLNITGVKSLSPQ